eukprot:jgi/Botrbrau1/6945/Bobra.0215s0022.1
MCTAEENCPTVLRFFTVGNWAPIVKAYHCVKAVPLCGGRRAIQDAAQLLEALLVPPAALAPLPQGKDQKTSKAAPSRPATASTQKAGGPNGQPFPLDQLHTAALAIDVVPTLLQICEDKENYRAARSAAYIALQSLVVTGLVPPLSACWQAKVLPWWPSCLGMPHCLFRPEPGPPGSCTLSFRPQHRERRQKPLPRWAGNNHRCCLLQQLHHPHLLKKALPPPPRPPPSLPLKQAPQGTPLEPVECHVVQQLPVEDTLRDRQVPRLPSAPSGRPLLSLHQLPLTRCRAIAALAGLGVIPTLFGPMWRPEWVLRGPGPHAPGSVLGRQQSLVPAGTERRHLAATKKGKVARKKGKKGGTKLEEGAIDAQIQASACLRIMSMTEQGQSGLMREAGEAARCLVPLLQSRVSATRWNARQTLLNLAIAPDNAEELASLEVPDYITGVNVPKPQFLRPATAPALMRLRAGLPSGLPPRGTGPSRPPPGLSRTLRPVLVPQGPVDPGGPCANCPKDPWYHRLPRSAHDLGRVAGLCCWELYRLARGTLDLGVQPLQYALASSQSKAGSEHGASPFQSRDWASHVEEALSHANVASSSFASHPPFLEKAVRGPSSQLFKRVGRTDAKRQSFENLLVFNTSVDSSLGLRWKHERTCSCALSLLSTHLCWSIPNPPHLLLPFPLAALDLPD